MQALHLEVGTPMIPLVGPFPKKSSCKMLKSYLSVYYLVDMRQEDCGFKILYLTFYFWPYIHVRKSGFVSHTKHIAEATYMNLFHSLLITRTMYISEFKNKIAYFDTVKFKTKDQKFLGTLLIFNPIPLYAQEVWSLNQFPKENN